MPTPYLPCLKKRGIKGKLYGEIKGDGTQYVLRTSSPRVGFSPTPSSPRKNKQTLEGEEGELEDGVLDKGTSDRVWKRSNLVHSKSGACARYALLLGNMR